MNNVTSKKEMLKILAKHGFEYIKTNGKHHKWTNGKKTVAISKTDKRFSKYTAIAIFKNAGIY